MSTASCTSFTGRSTQSEMRDRELMATETILHWRNLPLSLTFRTWLKFTRQRKVQRELLNYITNKKTMELMVNTLSTWRRELHTKVTARQHWVSSLVFFALDNGGKSSINFGWKPNGKFSRLKWNERILRKQSKKNKLKMTIFREEVTSALACFHVGSLSW